MTEDASRQAQLVTAIMEIRQCLLAPLPANMDVQRDAFGCKQVKIRRYGNAGKRAARNGNENSTNSGSP